MIIFVSFPSVDTLIRGFFH